VYSYATLRCRTFTTLCDAFGPAFRRRPFNSTRNGTKTSATFRWLIARGRHGQTSTTNRSSEPAALTRRSVHDATVRRKLSQRVSSPYIQQLLRRVFSSPVRRRNCFCSYRGSGRRERFTVYSVCYRSPVRVSKLACACVIGLFMPPG